MGQLGILLLVLYTLNFNHVCNTEEGFVSKNDELVTGHTLAVTTIPNAEPTSEENNNKEAVTTDDDEEFISSSVPTPFNLTTRKTSKSNSNSVQNNRDSIMWRFVFPTVGLAGIVMDSLGLVVLSKMENAQPFHHCLFSLLLVDELYLTTVLLWCVPKIMEPFDKYKANYFDAHVYTFFNTFTGMTFSICTHIITFMSIERFMKIAFPLKRLGRPSSRYFIVILVTIAVANVAIMVPGFFAEEGVAYFDEAENRTMYRTSRTTFGKENMNFLVNYSIIMVLVTKIVPLGIIIVCNTGLCVQLSRHTRQRAELFSDHDVSPQQLEQRRMTLTLMIISVSLTLSLLPTCTAFIIFRYHPEAFRDPTAANIFSIILDFGEIMQVFSAANDFLIYIFASKKCRSIVKGMRLGCWKKLGRNSQIYICSSQTRPTA